MQGDIFDPIFQQVLSMTTQFKFLGKSAPNLPGEIRIILGSQTVKAYVIAPHSFHVIGIVKFGMEFGLLARSDSGEYARVNGSNTTWLDRSDVELAICKAQLSGRGESYAESRRNGHSTEPKHVPTIVLKRHRRVDPDLASQDNLQHLFA